MSTATATMNPMQAGAPAPAANLPATTGAGMPAAQPNAPGADGGALATMPPSGAIAQVKHVLAQPSVKRSLPAIIALMLIVVMVLAYSWVQTPQTRALMPGLQGADLQEAFDSLKQAGFSPELDTITGQLRVDQRRFHEARIFLAGQGIPREPVTGLSA